MRLASEITEKAPITPQNGPPPAAERTPEGGLPRLKAWPSQLTCRAVQAVEYRLPLEGLAGVARRRGEGKKKEHREAPQPPGRGGP